MCTIMAGLAEFERDLIRDRVKSGLAAARARRVKLGRRVGQRPSVKKAERVLGVHADWPPRSWGAEGPLRFHALALSGACCTELA